MRKVIATLSLVGLASVVPKASDGRHGPLNVVRDLDLQRYSGTWYEIARLPNWFQKKCVSDVTATYTPLEDGRLAVLNACRRPDGTRDTAAGIARVADASGPSSKLKVRFAPGILAWLPFVWGDYQVMALDADYTHVLIGTPDRKYLWILARTPTLDEAVVSALLGQAAGEGFDVTRVVRTPQAVGS